MTVVLEKSKTHIAKITINYTENGVYKSVNVGSEVPHYIIKNWEESKLDGDVSALKRRFELKHIVESVKELSRFTSVERSDATVSESSDKDEIFEDEEHVEKAKKTETTAKKK